MSDAAAPCPASNLLWQFLRQMRLATLLQVGVRGSENDDFGFQSSANALHVKAQISVRLLAV